MVSRGVLAATQPEEGLSHVQRMLTEALFSAMTGHPATLDLPPFTPAELAEALAARDEAYRTRIVQIMVLVALVLRPLPVEVAGRVAAFARELSVDDGMLEVAHDWVHVLADYGTTVESELEVFAFIARANDEMHAFSLLAMVVSLFETGYLRTGAGLFQSDTGHLSREGMAVRVADAMFRGASCLGSTDFLKETDWFEIADLSVDAARARFGVVAKAAAAVAAGSVGPWEPGGISPFQERTGRELAAGSGLPYDGFGASSAVDIASRRGSRKAD